MPRKKIELHGAIWKEPIDTDAPPKADSVAPPEDVLANAGLVGSMIEGETEDGRKFYTVDPMTSEELQRTFSQLNPAQADALIKLVREAAGQAALAAAAQIIKQAEPPKPPVDTETPYLGPEFEPKRHKEDSTVSVSQISKALTRHGNLEPFVLQGKKQNEKLTVTLKNEELPPGVKLSFEDCRILDAVGMLHEEGWKDFTGQMVHNKMWGNDTGTLVDADEVERINDLLARYARTGLELIEQGGYFQKHGIAQQYQNTLLSAWGKTEVKYGTDLFVWHFKESDGAPPVPIYAYSKAINQTIEVPRALLRLPGRRSKNRLLMVYYLAIRADQAAKTKENGTDTILLETAYREICGDLPENTRAGRQKFKRFLSDCFVPVLEHFKQHGEIESYQAELSKSGRPSITITIPKNKIQYTPPKQIEGEKGKQE